MAMSVDNLLAFVTFYMGRQTSEQIKIMNLCERVREKIIHELNVLNSTCIDILKTSFLLKAWSEVRATVTPIQTLTTDVTKTTF